MKVSFSPALAEDIPHIFRLNKELIHRYEDLDAIPYEKVLGWVEHNIRQQLPHFRRIFAEGQLAGYFCLCPAEGKWELDSLFVLPEYQNRGIGTEVVRYCQNQADSTLFSMCSRRTPEPWSFTGGWGSKSSKKSEPPHTLWNMKTGAESAPVIFISFSPDPRR